MTEPQHLDDWAKEVGGRFARVLELRSAPSGVMARVRTDFSMDGIAYLVPDCVRIPDAYRQLIDRGEIDRRHVNAG